MSGDATASIPGGAAPVISAEDDPVALGDDAPTTPDGDTPVALSNDAPAIQSATVIPGDNAPVIPSEGATSILGDDSPLFASIPTSNRSRPKSSFVAATVQRCRPSIGGALGMVVIPHFVVTGEYKCGAPGLKRSSWETALDTSCRSDRLWCREGFQL